MSRNYDNWEKLVRAVLRKEKDRELAYCESLSSSSSVDLSSRISLDPHLQHEAVAALRPCERCAAQGPSNFRGTITIWPPKSQGQPCSEASGQNIFFAHGVLGIKYEEIRNATTNFEHHVVFMEGKFGTFYKGWVTVKKLKDKGPYKQHEGWIEEITCLTRRHPNLVTIVGYSFRFDSDNKFLVYEHMPNGSLANQLFERGREPLPWATRIKVAVDVARGLAFLHALELPVTHQNVRSSKIFLDGDFNAKLRDFNAKLSYYEQLDLSPKVSELHPGALCPNEYCDPMYLATGFYSTESDVYSFGLVLLELLSSLPAFDVNRPSRERFLIDNVKSRFMNRKGLSLIMDRRLKGQYPPKEAYEVAGIALKCADLNAKLRPRMAEVVVALEKLQYPISRSPREMFDPSDLSSQSIFFFRNVMAVEYEEIKRATKNFKQNFLLGEGGFGPVYKGWLHEQYLTAGNPGSGIAVAVKKLNKEVVQGHNQWVDEIHYLSQIHHPNIVKLIGYSFETDNRIVIYEFMPKGSLGMHLFTSRPETLPWATRIKVAVGVARALAFLHGLEIPVIHRNIKSSDILLDADFNPKLSDFGIAIDGPTGGMTHVETQVMGTYGYAAPEYTATGHLTTRCDVYGFGVVLLELITGLRALDKMRPTGEHNLVDWATPYLESKRRLSRIMDSRLKGQYPPKEAYKVAKIALQCRSSDPRLRPTMVEVVAALEKL